VRHRLTYAISPDRETWVDRVERGCLALEAACRSSPLMTSQEAEKADRSVADRRKYFRARLTRSGWPFDLTNGRSGRIKPGGESADNTYVGAGGQFYEPGQIVYRFNISFHTDEWSECERIFVSVGDAVQAYSAQITPEAATQTLRAFHSVGSGHSSSPQIVQEAATLSTALAAIGRQLPRLNDPPPLVVRAHPAQPKELGWINYWSAQTCEYLGFPDSQRDRDLLAHSYRAPAGAWLVKLCPEPLDLSRREHLSIFADTYARFPKLGIRAVEKKSHEALPMSYPQNTAFIHEHNLSYIVDLFVPFLRDRGLQVVERVPKGETQSVTVGLFPGASDWTNIKTIPQEFLAEKPPGVEEPRLFELCRAIKREGFMLNVYNQIEAVLLETDGAGRTHVSGFRELEEPKKTKPRDLKAPR
jgi:hypothetical protein